MNKSSVIVPGKQLYRFNVYYLQNNARGPQLIPNHVDGFKNHHWNQRITPRFFIRNHNMLLKISNFSYTLNHVTHKPLFG